jgi:S-adenosylmethionine synthetase
LNSYLYSAYADTGLTGRKIMVDTYGGLALHGGGAFSGKDATKVDRSGAYMARMIAKTIVSAGLAKRCGVSISYAIGKAEPVAVNVHTFATGKVDDEQLAEAVRTVFSLKPGDIIDQLGLRSPIYNLTSCYGHFGNALFAWEQVSERYMEALRGELEIHD